MEMGNNELTPEQKGVLASLSEETGEPISALINQVLDALQERLRARRASGGAGGHEGKPKQPTREPISTAQDQPIWEKLIEAGKSIPDEALEGLPTDLAANVDHDA
jgi:hypothetical protein